MCYGNISHVVDGSGCELCVRVTVHFMLYVYRVSRGECARLRENVP